MKQNLIPKIYGLIGCPVKHSLSPAMHNAAFKKLKLSGVYALFEAQKSDFPQALKKLRLMDAAGFNVTVPYKEAIIPYIDRLDENAKAIGAVNTVLNDEGKLVGYNTDAPGFIASLKNDLRFNPRNKDIFVIGAGGAARAIGFALAKEQARSIIFYDIARQKAERLAQDIAKTFKNCQIDAVAGIKRLASRIKDGDLLVNASTCGMKKADPLPLAPSLLPSGIAVYDIIYSPSPTRLVKAARKKGIRAVNGLGMLLYQGALAFEIWTGRRAPVETMRRALARALSR